MQQLKLEDYPSYLEQFHAFISATSPISAPSWQKICGIMNLWRVKKGTTLLDYSKIESGVRFLGKGIIKCTVHYKEKASIIDFRVAPLPIAEPASLLNSTSSPISYEAITDCDFIELPRNLFVEMIASNQDISLFCATAIANYLGMHYYKQALLKTMEARERYIHFLKEYPTVALEAKLEDIASYIGVTQQSLSRIRRNVRWDEGIRELETLSNELEVVHRKM